MDFYRILIHEEKKDGAVALKIRPDWIVGRSNDLMTRGGSFYAIWDEERMLWSREIYDVVRLVDADLRRFKAEEEKKTGAIYTVDLLSNNSSKLWDEFVRYIRNSGDNSHQLDEGLVFANSEVKKTDYASRRLSYSLEAGPVTAWDTIVGTLFNEEERAKIEWAIGAVVSGDSKWIHKFLVFYGAPGTGKSTIMNIIEWLFAGYTAVFDAKELTGSNNSFASSAFKNNPLVGIQHDGDLSRISDNTKLNSIVSHERMPVNEKYQRVVEMRVNAFLFMGTNTPVRISDAKAGLIRRLIDVVPTGETIENSLYHSLMAQVQHIELGAIAQYCLDRYSAMGKNYYSSYRPTEMMLHTDVFYNFVEDYIGEFKKDDGISLQRAWKMYKTFCEETGIDKPLQRHKMREELKNYFDVFEERGVIFHNGKGEPARSIYRGFKGMSPPTPKTEFPLKPEGEYRVEVVETPSIFDNTYPAMKAQYAGSNGNPAMPWDEVTTTLADLDTSKLHWVMVPEAHIVIDFDLRDENGDKNLEINLEAALKFPATYSEVSSSGGGLHLHYLYSGDVTTLASLYAEGIEIKTLLGKQALRRKLTKCNSVTITPLDGGLPKKEKPVIEHKTMHDEKSLRRLIERNLRKEINPGTKPSIDFIAKILEEAYDDGMAYDVSDMRGAISTFAMMSTNQSDKCIKIVKTMRFKGKDEASEAAQTDGNDEAPIVFFDCEVFKNLFVICWKYQGSEEVVRMINPTPSQVEPLFKFRLIGFNNRRYDNHILHARYLGYTNMELYDLTQRLFDYNTNRNAFFGAAYGLSYADIYDFSSVKTSLKKFQIMYGIFHSELDIPWDQEVPEELWEKVVDYCCNDVISEEVVFNKRADDFLARRILAELSGLTVNDTTQKHAARIVFGKDEEPWKKFIYTDLSQEFPGYEYKFGTSSYKGENPSEGGYVYAEPGMYEGVTELDITSMHPTTIVKLNAFGPYTPRFKDILDARVAIKDGDLDAARAMLDGKLVPYLKDLENAEGLAYALKIVINIVYGLTSASFQNPFKDPNNHDNIVAKRGALFMIELREQFAATFGRNLVHIKTDSVKIPNATQEEIDWVKEFGKRYGYDFKTEATYKRFCLVNDAVYIATDGDMWTAVGAQFQHPYVFKTLFSGEELTFDDFCETKSVIQGAIYLDFNETVPMMTVVVDGEEVEVADTSKMIHIGRTGSFVPVIDRDGGTLWRIKDGRLFAVTGTKGHKWVTREVAEGKDREATLLIKMEYFKDLVNKAKEAIQTFNTSRSFEWFTGRDEQHG